MQANEITRDRLRRLARFRPDNGKVLSLYVNLDPTQFATGAARSTEVRSLLNDAERLLRDDERLTHAERVALRDDLERVRAFLGGELDTKGAHGVAIFCSGPGDLFEVIKLPRPVECNAIVNDSPYVEPLARIGARERWCVLLANRHVARILCGSRHKLEEIERIKAEVGTRQLGGSPYPANETRTVDHEVEQHFKRIDRLMLDRFARRRLDGLLIGAPRDLAGDLEARLHPDIRRRLRGRVEVDIEHSTPQQVLSAAEPVIAAVARRREDEALLALAQRLGSGERAAAGLDPVLAALNQQRVEALLIEDGFAAAGVRCPTCEWLGVTVGGTCPADGTALLEVDDVVEAAVERAIAQDADIQVVGDRPELSEQGRIAALLRY